MRETRCTWMAGLAGLLLIVGCSANSSSSTSSSPTHGGNLTIAIDSFPQDLDPYSPTIDPQSLEVMNSWLEYLVEPSPDGSKLVPTLASSYQVSTDNRTYTFKLRSGVKFSNGSPMTTTDVVYSLHQAFEQKGSQINFLADYVASITSPDSSTVVVTLKKPWPYLLQDLSGFNAPILPASLAQSQGLPQFLKQPVGTGPFVMGAVAAGDSIKVTRNTNYWDPGKPYLDSITFKVIGSDVGRANAVKGGQADIAADPPLNQVPTLKSDHSVRLLTFPASELISIIVNAKQPPLDNSKVRRAIAVAIDRKAIVQSALFGTGKPANSFVVPPSGLTYLDTTLDGFPYDPTQAKQLLASAGVQLPLTIQGYFPQGAVQDAISTVMEQNLAAINVKLDIVRSDLVTIKSHLVAGTFNLASSGWDNFIGDPSVQVLFFEDPAYCCKSDFSGYDDKAAADLANRAVAATDPAQAKSLYGQVQRSQADSSHVLPLYFPDLVFMTTTKVTGFSADPFGTYSYPTIAHTK
jgi:peptide/nickel transport system substrate-binding protein